MDNSIANSRASARQGVLFGLTAYFIWGFLPLYIKLLDGVLPTEILAQRILWSVLFLAAVIAVRRSWPALVAAMRDWRAIRILSASALLIATNWFVYIWAVSNDHVLETSLGYFLNPLVNVVFGVLLLKERLTRAQTAAVLLAAVGVALLVFEAAGGLWISLALAISFATYGLLRKIAPVESLEGLAIETLLLAPLALAYVFWLAQQGTLSLGSTPGLSVLLALAGVLTALPLLLFAASTRRLRYTTVGLLQYIAPTIQFLLAVFAFREPLTLADIVCFSLIWAGLALYAADGVRTARRARIA